KCDRVVVEVLLIGQRGPPHPKAVIVELDVHTCVCVEHPPAATAKRPARRRVVELVADRHPEPAAHKEVVLRRAVSVRIPAPVLRPPIALATAAILHRIEKM